MIKWPGSPLNPDSFIPKEDQWCLQWDRLKRWFHCARQIEEKAEKKGSEKLTDYDKDILIAFFQNCYHFRHWLEISRPDLKKDIKKLFDDHFEMGFCRDICNGFKHKKLDCASIADDFEIFYEYDHFLAESNQAKSPIIYNIAVFDVKSGTRKKYNIFELMNKCFTIWESYIKTANLTLSDFREHQKK